nr:hypothetical protein [uncultured Chryseobacterium sp.]
MIQFLPLMILTKLIKALPVAFLLFTGLLYGQSADSVTEKPKAKIVLDSKAKIYSTDGAFNKQVSTGKIIHQETDVTYDKNASGVKIMKVSSTKRNHPASKSKDQAVKKKRLTKDLPAEDNKKKPR